MNTLFFRNRAFNLDIHRVNPGWFLFVGICLMTLSHMSWNVDVVGWIAMVPFLIYLHLTKGRKSRVLFYLSLLMAWSLIVFKIISDPIPHIFNPLYSVPITAFHSLGYFLYDRYKNQRLVVLIFPAAMVSIEWIQYTFTPFASWGIAAYTQVNSLNLIQSVSLFGVAGLGFVIYWANTAITEMLSQRKLTLLNSYLPGALIALLMVYGHLRLDFSQTQEHRAIKVAAVGTDSTIGAAPLPEFDTHVNVIVSLFERTRKAAEAGAQLVVWNEASFYLPEEAEGVWLDSIANLARTQNIGLTAAYVVPVSYAPLQYENKFVQFGPDGQLKNTYLKHQPVPGEPAIKGTEEVVAINLFGTQIGGAICYDYDFPYLARENGEAGVDILCLPSSDWKGIDPLHTQMASFRAIEQGHGIIRSTRFGLSAIIDGNGVMRARMSSFDENDMILISDIPVEGNDTIYAKIGDLLVYLSMAFVVGFLGWVSFYNKQRGATKVASAKVVLQP